MTSQMMYKMLNNKKSKTNNQLTPSQVKNLDREGMFCHNVDVENHTISVCPVFEKYECFDPSKASRQNANLAKDYIKAFFSNTKILDKCFWKANDNMRRIGEATSDVVEALGNSIINGGNFAKAILMVRQFLHLNPVEIAKAQLNAIRKFTIAVPHQGDLRKTMEACQKLIDLCEKFPTDAYRFFD